MLSMGAPLEIFIPGPPLVVMDIKLPFLHVWLDQLERCSLHLPPPHLSLPGTSEDIQNRSFPSLAYRRTPVHVHVLVM